MRYRPALPGCLLGMLALAACTTVEREDISSAAPAAMVTAPVAIGTPVAANGWMLTPQAVMEDSRCPTGTQCVWAGRVVVSALVEGAGGAETIALVAGEPAIVRGNRAVLTQVLPENSQAAIAPGDYRFVFHIAPGEAKAAPF